VQAKPDEIPTAGQVLRFRDGREGVVSSINSSGATVYVGPQAFMIPRGDWPAAFLEAMLASDYDARLDVVEMPASISPSEARAELERAGVDPVTAARVVPLPASPLIEREIVPAITRPEPGDERLRLTAAPEPAPAPPTPSTDDTPAVVVTQPSPASPPRSSRRDRKR